MRFEDELNYLVNLIVKDYEQVNTGLVEYAKLRDVSQTFIYNLLHRENYKPSTVTLIPVLKSMQIIDEDFNLSNKIETILDTNDSEPRYLIADSMGVGTALLYRWCKGDSPRTGKLKLFLDYFGISLLDFLEVNKLDG